MKYSAIVALLLIAGCSSPTAPSPVVTTPPVAVTPPVVTPPSTPARNPLLDDPRFSLPFYNALTHDGFEHPPGQQPLHRWTQAPLIYMQTVDDRNAPVNAALLEQTAAAIINTTSQWTGGAFGIAGLERGTATREGQHGWITVKWATSGVCGVTYGVTQEGGSIVMNHLRRECTCGPLVAKHELGHALGYWHTDSASDLMAATFQGVCDKSLSEREVFHSRLAYAQPNGSFDPH